MGVWSSIKNKVKGAFKKPELNAAQVTPNAEKVIGNTQPIQQQQTSQAPIYGNGTKVNQGTNTNKATQAPGQVINPITKQPYTPQNIKQTLTDPQNYAMALGASELGTTTEAALGLGKAGTGFVNQAINKGISTADDLIGKIPNINKAGELKTGTDPSVTSWLNAGANRPNLNAAPITNPKINGIINTPPNTIYNFGNQIQYGGKATGAFGMTSKTMNLLKTAGVLAGLGVTAAAMYVGILGTQIHGKFIKEETAQTGGYAMSTAFKEGDWDSYWKLSNASREVFNSLAEGKDIGMIGIWEEASESYKKFGENGLMNLDVMDKIAEEKQDQETNGTSDVDQWVKYQEDKTNDEMMIIDYYNEQRLATEKILNEEKEKLTAKEVKMWEDYKTKINAQEKAAQIENQNFWELYLEKKLAASSDSQGSKLSFGFI